MLAVVQQHPKMRRVGAWLQVLCGLCRPRRRYGQRQFVREYDELAVPVSTIERRLFVTFWQIIQRLG